MPNIIFFTYEIKSLETKIYFQETHKTLHPSSE